MIAETIASGPSPAAHHAFREALPRMSAVIRFNLRGCPSRDREEAVAEATAAAWAAWERLLRRGEDPVAVGVTGIAFNACRYVKNGRRVGNRIGGARRIDIYHRRARRAGGFRLVSLDGGDDRSPSSPGSAWSGWLAADRRWTPADEAAFRIDFAAWLDRLPAPSGRSPSCWLRARQRRPLHIGWASRPGQSASGARGWPTPGASSKGSEPFVGERSRMSARSFSSSPSPREIGKDGDRTGHLWGPSRAAR